MINELLTHFKKNIVPIGIFIIFLVTYKTWIIPSGILTSGDWVFHHTEEFKEYSGFPQIWQPISGFGSVELVPSFDFFKFFYSILSNFIAFNLTSRIIYLWPSIFFMPFFSYIFLSKILTNKYAIYIGVLINSLNTYYILLSTGNLPLMASFGFIPLILYLFKNTLENRNLKFSLLTTVALFFSSAYEPRATYITVWILFFYFIYNTLFIEKNIINKNTLKISILAVIPIFLTFLLNFYWIFPLAKVGALTNNVLFNRSLFGNEFLNINSAIALFHPFWTGSRPSVFIVQPIPIHFWIIPIFAFISLLLNRKNKYIPFFGFISLLGILLTKQAGQPFSGLYLWLYLHFPGFNAFREASKFYPLIAFGYSVLIAFFIQWLFENWNTKKLQIFWKYFLTILIAVIFIWNTKPFANGEIKTLFVPRTIPNDYLIAKEYLSEQSEYFRTLWIPVGSRWSFYINNHPKINTVEMINTDWNVYIKDKRNEKITEGELMKDVLSLDYSNTLLDLSSVKYVIVPLEDKANDDNFFVYYGKPRQYYINELDKLSYLHSINIGTREIVVYENYNFRPHIYITNQKLELKTENLKYKKLSFKFINPTEYNVTLKNINNPIYLNFSETYHPDWNIRVGNFNWFDVISKNNYFINESNHRKNVAGLNSFYIDPKDICQKFECRKNKDGSYDINLTLYFAPQSYMYLGLIISGTTLALIIGYLTFVLGEKLYERTK